MMKENFYILFDWDLIYYFFFILRWRIRNVAAIGGNIMTGSPISDLNPIFLAAGCCLQIGSVNGETEVKFDENFYTGSKMETED